MTVKQRVRRFLEKRDEPVSFDEIVTVAVRAGVNQRDIKHVLFEMDDVDVGVWYGTKDGNTYSGEAVKRYYRLYPMSDRERRQRKQWLKEW